jgi:hypothetical protein
MTDVILKAEYGQEKYTRKFDVGLNISFENLTSLLKETFPLGELEFSIKYYDWDGKWWSSYQFAINCYYG